MMSPTTSKNFFASYSRKDSELVEPVIEILRTTKTPVFFDIDSIEPGEKWRDTLNNSLGGSTTLILFWSMNAATSEWVGAEWKQAVHENKEIIPVLLDSTELPHPLSEYQSIDWRPFLSRAAVYHESPKNYSPPSTVKIWISGVRRFIFAILVTLGMFAPSVDSVETGGSDSVACGEAVVIRRRLSSELLDEMALSLGERLEAA